MNTIGNSCSALRISPKCEKCFGGSVPYKGLSFFLENFENIYYKKSMVFELGSNVFNCEKI
jgi:hypothetical protein